MPPAEHEVLRDLGRHWGRAVGDLAGSGGLALSLPIAFLVLAVGIPYRQTIRAYPLALAVSAGAVLVAFGGETAR